MTGAIFCERGPATIIRSAWRGGGRKTLAPKRARSKRAAAMDIISMAQQASPKPSGQMELLRAQFTALSSVVKMMPSSSRSLPKSPGLVSVTCLPSEVLMVFCLKYFRTGKGWRQIRMGDWMEEVNSRQLKGGKEKSRFYLRKINSSTDSPASLRMIRNVPALNLF